MLRDMMKRSQKKYIKAISVVCVSAALIIFKGAMQDKGQAAARESVPSVAQVQRVVDGDTVKLSDGQRIRLIGIDTPEVHYSGKLTRDADKSRQDLRTIQSLGRLAEKFTKDLVLGKSVSIEYDVVRRDKYGRTLAYLYLDDGTFVNARIIEEGYAQVLTIPPNVQYAALFLELERKARDSGKGLWSQEAMSHLADKQQSSSTTSR